MDDVFSAHRIEESIRLDPARTAILVVDMLNEFCKEGGAMVLPGSERLFPAQRAVISAAREKDARVIWVVDIHRAGLRRDREWLKRSPHCVEGSWGAEIVEQLAPLSSEMRILKHRYSGFFQTDLDLVLKDLASDQLVIFGVVTNICVRSTVHDAFFHGYTVIVPEDCCAATGPREQESSLYDIATHFGIVSDSRSVVAALTTGAPLANKVSA
jgi:ureidoacrylate peracid hydrolase